MLPPEVDEAVTLSEAEISSAQAAFFELVEMYAQMFEAFGIPRESNACASPSDQGRPSEVRVLADPESGG